MRAQSWTDVMTLLAVMVVSNKHEKANQLAVFKRAALSVRNMICPNVNLTDAIAGDWWLENHADIMKQTASVHYDSTVKRLLKNLNVLPNKKMILTALMKATLTDVDNKSSNGLVIHRMNESWKLDLPIAC